MAQQIEGETSELWYYDNFNTKPIVYKKKQGQVVLKYLCFNFLYLYG